MVKTQSKTKEAPEEEDVAFIKEPTIYQVGYLLVPTLSEEELSQSVLKLKDSIREKEGAILSEGEPKTKHLAYKMKKVIGHDRALHENAYFGWMFFTMRALEIGDIKTAYDENKDVLRFLITKAVQSELSPRKKKPQIVRARKRTEEEKEASSEEIDQAIEELVISE